MVLITNTSDQTQLCVCVCVYVCVCVFVFVCLCMFVYVCSCVRLFCVYVCVFLCVCLYVWVGVPHDSQAISGWMNRSDRARTKLVADYFRAAGGFGTPEIVERPAQ